MVVYYYLKVKLEGDNVVELRKTGDAASHRLGAKSTARKVMQHYGRNDIEVVGEVESKEITSVAMRDVPSRVMEGHILVNGEPFPDEYLENMIYTEEDVEDWDW